LVNTPPVSGAASGRPVSPNSGLVHWVSVMADHAHVPSPAHTAAQHVDSAVHYMWNGAIEVRMTSQSNQILVKQIFNQCKQIQCSLISVSIKNSIDIKVVNA
jgi:hypothetical protein